MALPFFFGIQSLSKFTNCFNPSEKISSGSSGIPIRTALEFNLAAFLEGLNNKGTPAAFKVAFIPSKIA